MFEAKRIEARERILGQNVSLLRTGVIDTQRGAVLTSTEALTLMRAKAAQDSKKRDRERIAMMQLELRSANRVQRNKFQAQKNHELVLKRRARLAGMPLHEYRLHIRRLKQRRDIAKARAAEKRATKFCSPTREIATSACKPAVRQSSLYWFASIASE